MKSILTPFQKLIFEAICKEKFITENFWLGGGTALSEFYLKHRYSEDLDFFTDKEVPLEEIRSKMDKILRGLEIKSVEFRTIQSSRVFFLKSGQKEVVKTDFNLMSFQKFGKMKTCKNLRIESLIDITLSKLDTILTRNKARDFVDFYFIQKENSFGLDNLLEKLEERDSWKIDPLYLASCFLKIENLKDYPKMIKELSKEEMIAFFLDLARQQKSRIVK